MRGRETASSDMRDGSLSHWERVGVRADSRRAPRPHPSPTQEPLSRQTRSVRTEPVEVPARIGAGASFDRLRTIGNASSARTGIGGLPYGFRGASRQGNASYQSLPKGEGIAAD